MERVLPVAFLFRRPKCKILYTHMVLYCPSTANGANCKLRVHDHVEGPPGPPAVLVIIMSPSIVLFRHHLLRLAAAPQISNLQASVDRQKWHRDGSATQILPWRQWEAGTQGTPPLSSVIPHTHGLTIALGEQMCTTLFFSAPLHHSGLDITLATVRRKRAR